MRRAGGRRRRDRPPPPPAPAKAAATRSSRASRSRWAPSATRRSSRRRAKSSPPRGVVHYIERLDIPGGALTRLRAGPFPTREAAGRRRGRLKRARPRRQGGAAAMRPIEVPAPSAPSDRALPDAGKTRTHVRHRRSRRPQPRQPAALRRLTVLQHRGQDAAGIVTAEGHSFHMHKGRGPGARRLPHARHARPRRPHGHRPLPLPDRGHRLLARTRRSRST